MSGCRICQNQANNQVFKVKEMMFGLGEIFDYFQCGNCGCLQILEIPENLGKYYPKDYYSLSKKELKATNSFKRLIRKFKIVSFLSSPLFMEPLFPTLIGYKAFFPWIKAAGIKFNDAILDVGCGSGGLLLNMKKYGFTNLTGIDPFLDEDIYYRGGPTIKCKRLDQLDEQFDFVMAHHSFEHMPNPEESLHYIYKALRPGKSALIRIPVCSSYAWKKFRTDWVQLDAPRHLYLHTIDSMQVLAKKTGFEIENIFYDSTEFQFWGSLQYQQNLPLTDARSYSMNRKASLFSNSDIRKFKAEARKLNAEKQGDSAGFLLRKG